MKDLYTPHKIRTYTGRLVDPFKMTLDDIDIEDIAHALSNICRFGGHTRHFLSVAQHSVWVADRLPDHLKLVGLLHDASEAYLLDIPKPLKAQLPGYEAAEHKLMVQIGLKFGFDWKTTDELLHTYDKLALENEWAQYVHGFRVGLSPLTAKRRFMFTFRQITGAYGAGN